MRKFYFDCTDAKNNPNDSQVAIPEEGIANYIELKYGDEKERVIRFGEMDYDSDAYYKSLDDEDCVVLCEWFSEEKIVDVFAKVVKKYETAKYYEWYKGVSHIEFRDGMDGELVYAEVYACDLDEEYIKAISEKLGHSVVYNSFHGGLFTKQMFDNWNTLVENMYNEIFSDTSLITIEEQND